MVPMEALRDWTQSVNTKAEENSEARFDDVNLKNLVSLFHC